MSEPTTRAGRALLRAILGLSTDNDGAIDYILAIEREARAATLAEVRREVEALRPSGMWDTIHRAAIFAVLAVLDRLLKGDSE